MVYSNSGKIWWRIFNFIWGSNNNSNGNILMLFFCFKIYKNYERNRVIIIFYYYF